MPTPTPLRHVFHPDHVDEYVATLDEGIAHLAGHLVEVTRPATGAGPEQAAKQVLDVDLDRPLGDTSAALDEMSRLWLQDAVWFHDPGYAAHLNCPIVIPALLAEVYIAAVNSSLDTFDQSVGATFIERHLVAWTAERLGLPADTADGIFTSGGSQSNLQALVVARGRAAAAGVPADRMRIITSADGHFSVQKSARLLGLGDHAVIALPTDEDRRMDLSALGAALAGCAADGLVPVAVVATAGTTDFGAIDPLPGIGALCAAYGVWFHVDAAYGGGLLASTRRRHLLAGIDLADSVTVDFHKTWFQPVSASALVVRDRQTLAPVAWHADYLNPVESTNPNQVDKSLQTTRRFDALKLWLTLRIMGPDQIGDYFDRVIDLAHDAHAALVDEPAIEVAAAPYLSTLVLRYRPDGTGDEEEVARLNTAIRGALYERGTSMVAATKVDGRQFLKLTLLNPMTTVADVLRIVAEIRDVGRELELAATAATATAGGAR